MTFSAGRDDQWGATFNAKPSAGYMYVRAKQTQGGKKSMYNLYWKTSTEYSWRTILYNYACTQNDMYSSTVLITKTNGRQNYDFLVNKTVGFAKKSVLRVEWAVR